ncbi:MAG: hypothetical protein AB8H79_09275 [Myxococcota bacterium]
MFTVSTLSRAREAAGEQKLVIVYLHEQNNPDCDYMSGQVWSHPDISAWVSEHAIAAKVDAYSFHGASLRGRYRVEQSPAILAFRGAEIARRHEGPIDPDALAAWLEVVRVGDVQMADAIAAPEPEPDPTIDVDARLVLALSAGGHEAAAAELLDLWRDTQGTVLQAERRPRVVQALKPHLESDAVERMAAQERDAAWARHTRKKTMQDLLDWMALNTLLDEEDKTVSWVKGALLNGTGLPWVRKVLDEPNDPILPLLSERSQWHAIGNSLGDPIPTIERRRAWYVENRTTITGVQSKADQDALRTYQGAVVAGLLAAGREREAKDAAEHVAGLDRLAGPAAVRVSIDAGQARRWMRKLVNPAKKDQVQLSMDLTRALQGL